MVKPAFGPVSHCARRGLRLTARADARHVLLEWIVHLFERNVPIRCYPSHVSLCLGPSALERPQNAKPGKQHPLPGALASGAVVMDGDTAASSNNPTQARPAAQIAGDSVFGRGEQRLPLRALGPVCCLLSGRWDSMAGLPPRLQGYVTLRCAELSSRLALDALDPRHVHPRLEDDEPGARTAERGRGRRWERVAER